VPQSGQAKKLHEPGLIVDHFELDKPASRLRCSAKYAAIRKSSCTTAARYTGKLIIACARFTRSPMGWKAKYYGFSLLFGASLALFAIPPLLALIIYGAAPLWLKAFILLFYIISHACGARNFS
jgi:hypothetical protein